jgi:hypothetical protein
LVLVLFLGISFAALREASPLWDGALLSVTVTALLIAILLAIHRAGSKRAFWLGFGLFGSIYLGLTLVPPVESRLATTQALVFLDSKIPGRPAPSSTVTWGNPPSPPPVVFQTAGSGGGFFTSGSTLTLNVSSNSSGGPAGLWRGTTENFIRIGQSILALAAAALGGLVSRQLYARSRGDD